MIDPVALSPYRAGLKAGEAGPGKNPQSFEFGHLARRRWPLQRPAFGESLGPTSPALAPALQGRTVVISFHVQFSDN